MPPHPQQLSLAKDHSGQADSGTVGTHARSRKQEKCRACSQKFSLSGLAVCALKAQIVWCHWHRACTLVQSNAPIRIWTNLRKKQTEKTMTSASSSSIRRTGPWSASRVRGFLAEARIPMRLAANTSSGFPVVLSLWFLPEGDEILAVVHRDARIAKRLETDARCAFEIAPNEPPYLGVRGQATVSLEPEGAPELLERLLDRYLGSNDSSLARFLLGRADEELVVRLQPSWIGSWDYSRRMEDALEP